jgi:hypothetical protein
VSADRELLSLALQVAVPVAIEELRSWTPEARQAEAAGWADIIASHGDDIMHRRGRGSGSTAEAFAALARGLWPRCRISRAASRSWAIISAPVTRRAATPGKKAPHDRAQN